MAKICKPASTLDRWSGCEATLGFQTLPPPAPTTARPRIHRAVAWSQHTVLAFAERERLVLAEVKTATKSNEITAIPTLLDLRSIEEAVVTIDAMGCQREIARKIVDKGADLGNAGSNGP